MAIYVGGDRTTLEYNFFAKVAGSITECPMKCYWARAKDLLLPTDIRWKEFNQENYDRIKNQDNISALMDATIVGEKPQFLIELDLNGLCNNLYAGSNAILEQNVKSIQLSAVVRGQGANGEVLGYLSKHYLYRHDTSQYIEWGENTTSSLVTSSNEVTMVGTSTGYITENNKIYMLLVANYPASSTILSALYLDYISIGLKLIRQPDVVPAMDVELGEEWSILLKGFSPNWENFNVTEWTKVLTLCQNNQDKPFYALEFNSSKKFMFRRVYANNISTGATADITTNKKFQSHNILIQQTKTSMDMYILQNASIMKKYTISDNGTYLVGNFSAYLGQWKTGSLQMNAFIDDIQFLNKVFTDQEAEIILKDKNPNLLPSFNNGDWYIHANASTNLEGTILTLVATANYQGSSIVLPILPNNRYKIDVEIEDINNLAHVAITQRCNNTNISTARVFDNFGNYTGEFITQDKVNKIVVICQNAGVGTFKFKNLKLRRLD